MSINADESSRSRSPCARSSRARCKSGSRRFSSSPPSDIKKHCQSGNLRGQREYDDGPHTSIVKESGKRAAREPQDSISGVENPVSRSAPARRHEPGDGGLQQTLMRTEPRSPAHHSNERRHRRAQKYQRPSRRRNQHADKKNRQSKAVECASEDQNCYGIHSGRGGVINWY